VKKLDTFGNADLARKIVSKFGTTQGKINAKMRHTKEVRKFIFKVNNSHNEAADSTLKFGYDFT
jgi:hypothetical protein